MGLGGWSQVCSEILELDTLPERTIKEAEIPPDLDEIYTLDLGVKKLTEKMKPKEGVIVSCDLHPFQFIPGVHPIIGDIRSERVEKEIFEILDGEKFDVIISDIHPGRSDSVGMIDI